MGIVRRLARGGAISLSCALALVGCERVLGLDDARTRASNISPVMDASQDDEPAVVTDALADADAGASPDAPDAAVEAPYVVSSLAHHTCVVGADRRAYCWGANEEGQLGDGTTTSRSSPVPVQSPFNADVIDVSAGYTHSCLVRRNYDVYCWGKNDRGQLGIGGPTDGGAPNALAPSLAASNVVRVGVAGWHTCALTTLGEVRCWGDNYYGALGDGTFERSSTYVTVKGLSNVVSLGVGVMHVCAATAQGHVLCWGRAVFGELGYAVAGTNGSPDPNDPGSPLATKVDGPTNVGEVVAGEDHTCANTKEGKVLCWGRNDHAQLGDGTTSFSRMQPAEVKGASPDDVTYAFHLSAGNFTSCATFTGDMVRCWGENTFGQLGNGNTNPGGNMPSPPVPGLRDIARTATNEHTCAWRKDLPQSPRKLYCWGRNDKGQLGLGHTSDYELQPQEVTFPAALHDGP